MKKIKYNATLTKLEGEIEVDDRMTYDEIMLTILTDLFEIHYKEERGGEYE